MNEPPRAATRADVPAIRRIRAAVRENRLVSTVITDTDIVEAIEVTGRGWVVEEGGRVVGFGIADRENGSLWALFIDPDHESRGHGRRLHDTMVGWLRQQGWRTLRLSTDPGTRAERFYQRAGWVCVGDGENGEVRYELGVHQPRRIPTARTAS